MNRLRQFSAVAVATLLAGTVHAGAISAGPVISVEAPTCLVAGRFPQLEAIISPSVGVAKARLMFKAGPSLNLLSVDMVPGIGNYLGTMTRPAVKDSPVTFFVEASGPSFGQARSTEFKAVVVEREQDCAGRKVARMVSSGPSSARSASGLAGVFTGFAGGTAGGFLGLSTTSAVIAASGAPVPTTVGIGGRNVSPRR